MSFDTRKTLLMRVRDSSDNEAWTEFVSLYSPLLARFFVQRGVEREDAQDISQNVLRRVSGAASDFRYDPAKGKFRSWLFRIADNEWKRFIARKLKRDRFESPTDRVEELGERSAHQEMWDLEYRKQMFDWACEQVRPEFSDRAWKAFWSITVEEKSPGDVAEELGVSVGAVYISKSRVIARLRERVSAVSGEEDLDGIDGS